MDIIEKYDVQLDNYILDELNTLDKKAFEEVLNGSPELKNELALRKSIHQGVEQIEISDIRSRIKTISQSKTQNKTKESASATDKDIKNDKANSSPKSSNNGLKYILLLLGLLALLFFASKFFSTNTANNNANIPMADYFEPMPMQISERGAMEVSIEEMTTLYNNKEYAKVTPILDKLLVEKNDVKWNLYRGIALYETGEYGKAFNDFKLVANSENYLLSDHGIWYQALTALKLNDKDTAKTLLSTLSSKANADHAKEAKKLLGEIK